MTHTANQRAIIYCRVSDKKQKHDGDGLHSQEHRCRDYAASRIWGDKERYPRRNTGH